MIGVDLTQIFPTDHSKISRDLVFNVHSDAGHGWIAVKIALVRELGIAGQITAYSYMQGGTAYLEEDCDATLFFKAFTERFGHEPRQRLLTPRNRSPIRHFKRFKVEL